MRTYLPFSDPFHPMHSGRAEFSYPHFRSDVIDTASGSLARALLDFPFRVRGRRIDDLIAFRLGADKKSAVVTLYDNPHNHDSSRLCSNESYKDPWEKITVQTLRSPFACVAADISGSGFHDLIITDEYSDAIDSMDPYGGRVSWFENFGTDDGDWTRRDIGRFPGVNCIKVGHFTTTFSLQILAVVQSKDPNVACPLIIFTRPSDVYKSRFWLATVALENTFSAIHGCLVIKATSGGLDEIVISSLEGLSVVWYSDKQWHWRSIGNAAPACVPPPGQLALGRIKNDDAAYIVCAEASNGPVLSIYVKQRKTPLDTPFESISWTRIVLEDFVSTDKFTSTSIRDILCSDWDGDGVDEILVAVSSTDFNNGIYYYDFVDGQFVKYKISDNSAEKLTAGRFTAKGKMDFATISTALPRTIEIHVNSFVTSQIRPIVNDSDLVIYIPRITSVIEEADVIDIAGRIHSLVLLPPDASFPIPTDGTNAVKVLHGCLGWIDSQSELIERMRATGQPGCVTSMLVDSPEGYVRSGNDGAVFIRMRPSCRTTDANLRALNVLPSHFPCEVRDVEFLWRQACRQPWFPAQSMDGKELYHLSGFHIRFDSRNGSPAMTTLVYVHLWAAAPGVSSGFHKRNVSPLPYDPSRRQPSCSIRACLANPTGAGALHFCDDVLDGGVAFPDPSQLARAKKTVLPVMHEHGPIWRFSRGESMQGRIDVDADVVESEVEYPWHAWVAGPPLKCKERLKWDVWVAFDFLPFGGGIVEQRRTSTQPCIIC